jgi:hypothetical protein
MTYIGVSPSNGVRRVHTYTASGSQTSFTGSSSEGINLSYVDANFVDVYQNGVLLAPADYTATSGTSIVLGEGAAVNDIITITVYDAFSVADTVSKSAGGTFDGNVTMGGNLSVDGNLDVTGSLDMSDANLTNVGSIQLDSISGDADTNTNITFAGSDVITATTGGSERFRINSSGVDVTGDLTVDTSTLYVDSTNNNIGIGTTSPTAFANYTTVAINGTTGSVIDLQHAGTINSRVVGESGGLLIDGVGSRFIKFHTNSTERMRIDSNGNVGIGNSSPATLGNSSADDLVVGTTSGDKGITVVSGAAGTGRIAFADSGDTLAGRIVYDHNTNGMSFGTAGASQHIILDNSGNVGIGGTPTNASDHKSLALFGASGTGAGFIEFNDTSGNADGVIFADGGNLFINADYDNTKSSSTIRFRVDGSSEKMRIDSSGNVGIGITTPRGLLHVNQITASSDAIVRITNTNTPSTGNHRVEFADGTGTSEGSTVFRYGFIAGERSGGANNGHLIFGTKPDNGSSPTERMRIDSSGRTGIGITNNFRGFLNVFNGDDFNTVSNGNCDNIYLVSDATSGDNVYGASIAFSRVQYPDRRGAAIASVQTGSDEDNVGLAFFTHPSTTAGDPIVEAMRIDSSGRVRIGTENEINLTQQSLFVQGSKVNYASVPGLAQNQLLIYDDTSSTAGSGGAISFGANTGSSQKTWIAEIEAGRDSSSNDSSNYAGSLRFYTRPAQNIPAERMRITSSGNVGIGTSGPSAKLEIIGASNSTATFIKPQGTLPDNNDNAGLYILHQGAAGTGLRVRTDNAITGSNFAHILVNNASASINAFQVSQYGSGYIADFNKSGTTAMRIDSSGNVGIGTSSPTELMHLSSSGPFNILLERTGGAPSESIIKNSGNRLQFSNNVSGINFDTGATPSERMRIDSSGNLLVGKTSTSKTVEGAELTQTGTINIGRPAGGSAMGFYYTVTGASVGKIAIYASSTQYVTTSDYRLKENVSYDFDATTRLKQLKPARFNFIADADTTVDGFLAHEVQSVVPEAINGTHNEVDADGNAVYQGIDQSKLVPLLVKTIQELEARITTLENA